MKQTYSIILLLGLMPASIWAQAAAPSILISSNPKQGTGAKTVADFLKTRVYADLQEQYPCVDLMTDDGIGALLDLERQRELLGGGDDALLGNIASSLGAQTLITITVTIVGAQTFMNVSTIDAATGKPSGHYGQNSANGDAALDGAESLARQVVNGLPNFKGKCDAHWNGSITWEMRESASQQNTESHAGGKAANGQRDESTTLTSYSWKLDEVVDVLLTPMSSGSTETNFPMAKFNHEFLNDSTASTKSSGTMWCRKPDSNPTLVGFGDDPGETYTAGGKNSWKQPVAISVGSDGTYSIEIKWDDMPYNWKRSKKEPGTGCPPSGGGEILTSGSDAQAGSGYSIHGKTDPKKADTLTGREQTPIDPTAIPAEGGTGAITVTWNLKLVKPKSRK